MSVLCALLEGSKPFLAAADDRYDVSVLFQQFFF